jgi:hypothetical protein
MMSLATAVDNEFQPKNSPYVMKNLLVCDACSESIMTVARMNSVPKLYIRDIRYPLDAITMFLRNNPVHTMHIMTHGRKGAIKLGGNWITADELNDNSVLVSQWQANRIALWSSETGADMEFVETLSSLTGAEIYSSPFPVSNTGEGKLTIYSVYDVMHLDEFVPAEKLSSTTISLS